MKWPGDLGLPEWMHKTVDNLLIHDACAEQDRRPIPPIPLLVVLVETSALLQDPAGVEFGERNLTFLRCRALWQAR